VQAYIRDLLHYQLGYAISAGKLNRPFRVKIHDTDLDLPTIPGINRSGSIEQRDSVLHCQPATWDDKGDVPDRERDRDPGRQEVTLTRRQQSGPGRVKIESSIPWVLPPRQRHRRIDPANQHVNSNHSLLPTMNQSLSPQYSRTPAIQRVIRRYAVPDWLRTLVS
jgi:hypothetical protein